MSQWKFSCLLVSVLLRWKDGGTLEGLREEAAVREELSAALGALLEWVVAGEVLLVQTGQPWRILSACADSVSVVRHIGPVYCRPSSPS